jgi:hypothetical protein
MTDFIVLLEKAREYLPPEKISVVEGAYNFAAEKHGRRAFRVTLIWNTLYRRP